MTDKPSKCQFKIALEYYKYIVNLIIALLLGDLDYSIISNYK